MHRLLPLILSLTGSRIDDISVRHHPRSYGRSKYGLSRIYKVLLDLFALKWVLTRHRSALFGFGMSALILSVLNVPIFAGIVVSLFLQPAVPIVVFSGTFLLIASLGVFLLMMGILAELIYRTGYIRIDELLARRTLKRG
jgi:hypothetical protein